MAPRAPEYSHPKSQISGKWKITHWLSVTVINTGGVTTNEFLYWTIKLISMTEQKVLDV